MTNRRPKQRRALSTVRDAGPIERRGAAAEAEALARALSIGPDADAVSEELTHRFHTYPARMHPATARKLVTLGAPARVLDPFCGSGTVLVEARARGAAGFGVDANPLAVLLARVKATPGDVSYRRALRARAEAIAAEVVAAGKAARRSGGKDAPHRGSREGREARDKVLAGWFAPHVRRELEALAGAIDRERDPAVGAALRAVLSSILYKVSRRESDTSTKQVQRSIGRGFPSRLFAQRAAELDDGLAALAGRDAPPPVVTRGDARKLADAGIAAGSMDAVVSSPPYAGTYDYLEHQKLRMAFLGLDAGGFSAAEIGARRAFRRDRESAWKRWERDLGVSLRQIARALRRGGTAALVVGDSLAGNRAVYADDLYADLAPDNLERVAAASQSRPQLGAAEARIFETRPKREHILLFRKL